MSEALQGLLAWKAAAVALWFLLVFLAERWRPAAPPPAAATPARLGRNLLLWSLTLPLSLLLVLPLTEWASGQAVVWRPSWWQGWSGLLLDLLLLDGLIYWWHRANHRLPFLWRFHGVHHRDRFLDSSSALRFHVGEVALSALARAGVILLLGFPLTSVLVFETLVLFAAIFHHSNLRLPPRLERALSWILVTPSIHWVHHHARRGDTDANYATILSLWDRLFASRSPTPRRPDMTIGAEGLGEKGALALILLPFRRG